MFTKIWPFALAAAATPSQSNDLTLQSLDDLRVQYSSHFNQSHLESFHLESFELPLFDQKNCPMNLFDFSDFIDITVPVNSISLCGGDIEFKYTIHGSKSDDADVTSMEISDSFGQGNMIFGSSVGRLEIAFRQPKALVEFSITRDCHPSAKVIVDSLVKVDKKVATEVFHLDLLERPDIAMEVFGGRFTVSSPNHPILRVIIEFPHSPPDGAFTLDNLIVSASTGPHHSTCEPFNVQAFKESSSVESGGKSFLSKIFKKTKSSSKAAVKGVRRGLRALLTSSN